jgi:hypothetical protein
LFLAACPAIAADAPPKLAITIYNQDLAMVQDVRRLDIGAGRSHLEFKDVSGRIRPNTVSLVAPDITILEQNFDFDLLTPAKMMEKAVGQQVQIVRTNPGNGQQVTETATVLSANGGVVLKIGDRIEVLRDDGAPTRVIFAKVPDNLRARPTLSVDVESTKAGVRDATLSYLTGGLSWRADYVAQFDEPASKLNFQGWITLTNTSGTTFENADTQLVAGDLKASGLGDDWRRSAPLAGVARAGTEAGQGQRLGEYYVYPLAQRTTIASNQTKQVGFIDVAGVSAHKAYQYRADWFQSRNRPANVDTILQFDNSAAGGLASQLPAGTVRVYMKDAQGSPKFIGENNIDHTPQGSALAIKTGEAFDVTVQPTMDAQQRVNSRRTSYSMTYVVRNARPTPVTVELLQGGLGTDGKVISESLPSRRRDAYSLVWAVSVPAEGETTLKFKVETGY